MWLLKTFFLRKTGQVDSKVADMQVTFFAIFDSTCIHIFALKGPSKEFL